MSDSNKIDKAHIKRMMEEAAERRNPKPDTVFDASQMLEQEENANTPKQTLV